MLCYGISYYQKYQQQIKFISEKLSRLGVAQLERLATAFYVTMEEGREQTVSYQATRVHELKPHVPLNQAIDAVQKVDELG